MIYQDYLDKNRLKSLLADRRVMLRNRWRCAALYSLMIGRRQGRLRLRGRACVRLRASRLRNLKLSVGEFLRTLVDEAAQQETHRRNRLDANQRKIAENECRIAEG
jgi:hypothetical protein